jgi:hypothetical protein
MAIWAIACSLRWYREDRQVITDCVCLGIMTTWMVRGDLSAVFRSRWQELDVGTVSWVLIWCFLIIVPFFALFIRWRAYGRGTVTKILPEGTKPWNMQYPKAKIFPSQTKHARMFPKRHAFEYSYLQCGFPIIPAGIAPNGMTLGSSKDCHLGSWWLRIRDEDHLDRGNGALGFYGKLQLYLREHVGLYFRGSERVQIGS